MFKEWGFLLTEIWVLLVLAALIGLFAGWLIWGGRAREPEPLDELRGLAADLQRPSPQGDGRAKVAPVEHPAQHIRPEPLAQDAPVQQAQDPIPEPTFTHISARPSEQSRKPAGLSEARHGLPDDLTKVKGIGPKLEKLCNSLGYWHYDQIAAWNAEEIAWVDENLEGFKGRVSRDNWVAQAGALAQNEPPDAPERD